jgi:hypothetical protein
MLVVGPSGRHKRENRRPRFKWPPVCVKGPAF